MRLSGWSICAAAAVACALPARATAQGIGFWLGAGLGTGVNQVGCDICLGEANGGWAARLAAGGTLSARLKLGAELHGWRDNTEDIGFRFISVMPALYWYPSASTPYFLMGGVGFASFHASDANQVIKTSSVGLTVGVGYDLPLAGRVAVTPFASYTGSFLANLTFDRTQIASAQVSLFQVGLGLTRR